VLPLYPELVSLLRSWLVGLSHDELLFPKLAKRRTWLMVKKDLERVGIPYETTDGIADFHAAGRHTHITELLRNGASLPEAKELARHSDVTMTMRYTHIGMDDREASRLAAEWQRYGRLGTSRRVNGCRDPQCRRWLPETPKPLREQGF